MQVESEFPPILGDQIKNNSGLIICSGSRRSALEKDLSYLKSQSGIQWEDFNSSSQTNAEGLVLKSGYNLALFEHFLRMIEAGARGLIMMTSSSVLCSLRQILSIHMGDGRTHVVHRFIDQLNMISHQASVVGLAQTDIEVREIVLINSENRSLLYSEDLSQIENLLKSENTHGSVSMNQSLVQLLLRRKIDLKTAFATSKDPSHLDQMLKSVGI
jgi:hypothetical protein